MPLMKEFLFTPGMVLTSLGSIIGIVIIEDMITSCWVYLDKLTKIQEPGVMNQGWDIRNTSSVKD